MPPEYSTVACAYCGKERQVKYKFKAYALKCNPNHRFFCGSKCHAAFRSETMTLPLVTEKCGLCGTEFQIDASAAKTRKKKNAGGMLYCSAECGSVAAGRSLKASQDAALAAGEFMCNKCKAVKPLSEFRRKTKPGSYFPYMSVCKGCKPPPRRDIYHSTSRVSPKEHDIRTRDAGVPEDEALSIARCDHTPVAGPSLRAPDWRILSRVDAAEYKWSCRICGFSHKEYDRAKECCEPKGTCEGTRFIPFDEYQTPEGRRAEAARAAHAANTGASGSSG